MSVSERPPGSPPNQLYRVAAISGAVIAVFLFLGSYGHFAAVWPTLTGAGTDPVDRMLLALPGAALLVASVINASVLLGLYRFRPSAVRVALVVNLAAALYFAYLLSRGVPDHPIGFFVALVTAHTLVLGSIHAGLRWPAVR